MNSISSSEFRVDVACDPHRSVIVSACAGSGKTWLLVARMVRLLLAGAKPQDILALTFTRKAAQEMRDRLYRVLEEFSNSGDAQLMAALKERGLSEVQAKHLFPMARALYANVLASPKGIVIDTFHGWFGRLLGAAPISTGIQPGFSLREDAKRLHEECLDDWWGDLPPEVKVHYDVLLMHLGASETHEFVMGAYSLFKQRGAWAFFSEHCADLGTTPIAQLKKCLSKLNAPNPLERVWNALNAKADLDFLQQCFSNSSATERAYVPSIELAISHKAAGGDVSTMASVLEAVFLTGGRTNRTSNDRLSSDLKNYLKTEGLSDRDQEHIAYKQAWAVAFLEFVDWQKEQEAYTLNEAWFAMSASMLAHVSASKEAMRVRDFDDLEIGVTSLMAEPGNAAYLQARLDARYRHILVDEFQDTNPLQWQILRAWLEGYGQDDSKPTVFIVGDPKQSIYRFRRADPRLFINAQAFLDKELQAVPLNQNTTRRNAPNVNAAVNAVFGTAALPMDYPFTPQDTLWRAPAVDGNADCHWEEGEAYLLPLLGREELNLEPRIGNAFERAIVDTRQTVDVAQRYVEGQKAASLIAHLINTRLVVDQENGKAVWRKARESDFLLLVKRRRYLPQYERALREVGIAFESARSGGLLHTLEVDDLIALLTVLLAPRHDLPLAQVLRSPIFGFTDIQMQNLAKAVSVNRYRSWWDALQDSQDADVVYAARYLEYWRLLGERLPVHDLLDRIYQESDLRMKYAGSANAMARPQVLANIDAFLELALNQDGGRYPSLGRFIEEINAIREGADDETPDEGDAELDSDIADLDNDSELSDEDKTKRVRLMTIHGAKGLEAPFVILLDANHTEGKVDHRGVLLDWPPEHSSPTHLSMYTSATLTGSRNAIREGELEIGKKENWNLLYVAMTRAKQGLWISGVAKSSTKNNPIGLDEKSWYGRARLANLPVLEMDLGAVNLSVLDGDFERSRENTLENPAFLIDDFELAWSEAKRSHQEQIRGIESGVALQLPDLDSVLRIPQEILEAGVHFHLLLERFTSQTNSAWGNSGLDSENVFPSSKAIADWLQVEEPKAITALERVKTVLNTPVLKPYLSDCKWVQAWNEIDILNSSGSSFRLDRLVEFEDRLVVLDFKLTIPSQGDPKEHAYREQLKNYMRELARIRPDKPIEAYLISAKGEMESIA